MSSGAAGAPGRTGIKLIEDHVPSLYSWWSIAYIVTSFLAPIVLTHFINRIGWWAPLISAAAWNALAFYLMSRMSWNAEAIRERYRARYGDRAYEPFFYRYVVPVFAPCMIPFLMIGAVANSRFVPPLYPYDHVLYRTLAPWGLYVALGVSLLIFSIWAMRKSVNGGFDLDTELFLYIIYPEKSFPIQGGMYQYVRHAHYAEGIWMGIGAAFLAQNWMGFLIAFMFLLPYYGIARAEDRELIRRYSGARNGGARNGASFETTVKSRPMFFPRLKDLGSLVKWVLRGP